MEQENICYTCQDMKTPEDFIRIFKKCKQCRTQRNVVSKDKRGMTPKQQIAFIMKKAIDNQNQTLLDILREVSKKNDRLCE